MISSLERQRSLQQWNLTLKEAQVSINYKSSLKKNVTNAIKDYRTLENKYNKLQESLKQSQQKKTNPRGQGGASNKKKSSPSTARKAQPQRGRSTSKHRTQQQGSRQPHQQKGKADDTTNVVSNEHGTSNEHGKKLHAVQALTITTEEKSFLHRPQSKPGEG